VAVGRPDVHQDLRDAGEILMIARNRARRKRSRILPPGSDGFRYLLITAKAQKD
jgi:hypothetical protein